MAGNKKGSSVIKAACSFAYYNKCKVLSDKMLLFEKIQNWLVMEELAQILFYNLNSII